MMSEEQFEKLCEQNRRMIKLLAAIAIHGKTFREQISLLSDVGLQPGEIAEITGKDANTIRVTKTLMKKKK